MEGRGAVERDPENIRYNATEEVELTATPESGWTFTEWSGDLTGSTNPTTITMDSDKIVTATFNDITPPTITNISTTPPITQSGENINITCFVDDNFAIDSVKVNITGPDNFELNTTMETNAISGTVNLEDIDSGQTSPTGEYRWLDVANQTYCETYRNNYNYTQATVNVTYNTHGYTLSGTLSAENLKPNFAYQLKLAGTPGTITNERIGLTGRWWQEEWNGTAWTNGQNLNNKGDGSSPNPNDLVYFSRRNITDPTSPTGLKYKFTGYLVFDYFITDEHGNASIYFDTGSCYHVLWKTTQRSRVADDGPIIKTRFIADSSNPAYDEDYPEQTVDIFGEWERLPMGGVPLQPGNYLAQIMLTEESFHGDGGQDAGNWAAAMGANISFNNEGIYYHNQTYTSVGTYNYFIWAKDPSNNIHISTNLSFIIQDANIPFTEKWWVDLETLDIGENNYSSHIGPVIANTIDNGYGPDGKPILEIYQQAGLHAVDYNTTSGRVYCFKGDTGEIIWSYFHQGIGVHATLELGDADQDGKLELLVSAYHHVALLNAEDGSVVWSFNDWEHRRDKHNLIINNPEDGQTYVYTSQMYGYLEKRNASTGEVIKIAPEYTSGPCFGGLACADLNNNGSLELIESGGGLYCYDLNLNLLWKKTDGDCYSACPIIADVNKDSILDVIGCMRDPINGGIGVVDGTTGDWMQLNGETLFDTTLGLPTYETARVYDIDLDGNLEYITAAINPDGENGYTCVWDLYNWEMDAQYEPKYGPAPMVENIMGDEVKELVHLASYWVVHNHTYDQVGYYPQDRTGKNPHAVADVDGDGYSELVTMYRKWFNGQPSNCVCTVFDLPVKSSNTEPRCWNQLYSERRCGAEEFYSSLAPLEI